MTNTFMSRQTRAAGLSFLSSLLVVVAVSASARYFYDNSQVTAAEAEMTGELLICQ